MESLRIRDLAPSAKPRERMLRYGADHLSDAELIACIIGTGTEHENAVMLANRILAKIPLYRLAQERQSLQRIPGIGPAKSCALLSAFEIAKRQQRQIGPDLSSPEKVFQLLAPELADQAQEHFIGLYLDTRKRLIAKHVLFKGTLDAIVVHPREIFNHALTEQAAAMILAHNHPSGDPEPSDEDIMFTKRLMKIGKLMQIELLDHVIVGKEGYYSFAGSRRF